jgi:murein DD-endopeptidase MepM/ murein hydrolase activator NlpD
MDEKSMVSTMIAWGSVPTQNTQEYRQANLKVGKYRQYSAMSPSQLVTNMKQGNIRTEMDWLLSQNPNYLQAKQEFAKIQQTNHINNVVKNWLAGMEGKDIESPNYLQNISDKVIASYGMDETNAQAFAKFIGTSETMTKNRDNIATHMDQLSSLNRQASEVTKTINEGMKQINADYPNLSASARLTLMSSRFKDANDTLTTINESKRLLEWDLNMEMLFAKDAYSSSALDVKNKYDLRSKTAENFTDAKTKADAEVYKNQALFDQKLTQEAQIAKDPIQAVKSVIKTFTDLGIVPDRTESEMIADIQNKMAKGMTLGQATTELQKTFKSKPEYAQALELKMWALSDSDKLKMGYQFDISKMWLANQYSTTADIRNFWQQMEIAKMQGDITRQNYLWQIQNDPEKQAKALEIQEKLASNKSLYDVLGMNVGDYAGNRWHDLAGKIGDPLVAGGTWTVKSVDQAWELWVPYIAWSKKPYGNTVVMTDENGNEVRYSHLESIGVKPWDTLGFWDMVGTRWNTGNVKWANGEILTAEQLKAWRWAHVDIEIKNPSGKLMTQAEQVSYLKSKKVSNEQSISDQKFTQFNQMYSKFKSDPWVQAFESALNAWGDMVASLKSENWPWDVGAVFSFMKALDPASVVKEWEFKLARESGWLDAKFDNLYWKVVKWEQLTDDQRKAFGKISFEYIRNKWKMYDVKYNDFTKVLKNQKIPESFYPTKMTDMISSYESNIWSSSPVPNSTNWVTWASWTSYSMNSFN